MTNITSERREFAQRMTVRQWSVLTELSRGVYYLSVTEACDPELQQLVRNGLVGCHTGVAGNFELPQWTTTSAGQTLLMLHESGEL